MGQLEAKVESHFHIETGAVDGYARVVDCIKEWPEGRAVLCAYSTPRSLASRHSKKVQDTSTDSRCGTSNSGVLAVDIEHGEVLWDAGFLKVDDKTLYMNILGVGERDSSSIRQIVVCVTDGGGVWGVDVDVKEAHERNVHFLGSIAAMFLNGQSRITSYIEKARNDVVISENQIQDNVAPLEEEVSYDSVGMEKSNDEPEFVSECGYRGPREGYTFWTNDRGENGYYRNDVMQKILEKDLNASKMRDDASENCSPIEKKECLDSESGPVCSYRKFIRCFEYLDRLKQFVISSVGSEDGTIYTGRLDMIESSASLLTVEAEVKRDVDAHESGVLVFASTTDQKVVASGSYDQKIKIWDTSQWNCLKILSGHGGGIKNLLFTPDDSTMISTSSDNTIRLWSCAAWLCLRHLHGRHEDTTWPVCLDYGEIDDGTEKGETCTVARKLVVSGSNGLFGGSTLKLFDFESGDCLANFAQLRFDHKGSCSAIKLLRGGKLVISAATDGTLAGWKCSLSQKQTKALKKGFFG